ncbi:MAG TPA: cob(I)yrinic acid a,c-diamide adenosyltransferase [Anaerolineales bacterium]|jgi:cob(I)alamin adenosyltransferase|nr:cob(I)yrinic acid a,c-diamide adenosyltransferase [Anaerolineales bacterium]MDP7545277.1 cob(I)yrinic acid a,c-diamide adenosyltransferase [Anaerolineales bacterium]HJL70419.1 cob(I)yrinic acid a,c-diamide adenosyltransferase [Anaerolineales bacterium]HJN41078.1 cob(I)yrinic acid a,c-diamide adenosyltransferase [Anaerolineales bacterium]|tara:strand:- start:1279 stop:1845 length:567 start_codon:yes stop_codon:yes gene_type:complete
MPRISRPATRTGDDGTTATANGKRVAKDSPQIRTFGAIDELNSVIGVALSQKTLSPELIEPLHAVQNDLFHLGAELNRLEPSEDALAQPRIEDRHIRVLDQLITELYDELGPLQNFTLPGGAPTAASLHLARAVCRRAESEAAVLASSAKVRTLALQYLNRLSDALFLMARAENRRTSTAEPLWHTHR